MGMTTNQLLALAHMGAAVIVLHCNTEEEVVAILANEDEKNKAPATFFQTISNVVRDTYKLPDYSKIIDKWIEDNKTELAPEDQDLSIEDFIKEEG